MKDRMSAGFTISEILLVFLVVIIIGGLMMPVISYNHRKMEKAVCANNLRNIGLALFIYAKEHDGQFPRSLKTLYDEEYLADKNLMSCPAVKNMGTPENPDYVYTPGLTVRDYSMASLVGDKAANHPGGAENVLYVSGEVAWKE